MLERESSREKNLEKAAKDAKVRARRAAEAAGKERASGDAAGGEAAAKALADAEAEFYALSGIDPATAAEPEELESITSGAAVPEAELDHDAVEGGAAVGSGIEASAGK